MPEHPQKIGPYQVLQRLGAGGMGEVFLAYDDRLDRQVAVKRIRPDAGTSPQRRERFRREARVSARLNHPAVVQVYDILSDGDLEYIVMEYVEGTNLFELIERGRLEVRRVIDLAREIAEGLEAAHRLGIVHRDLKAENILVTRLGHAKISDFGIAKQLLADSDDSLTRGNAVLGTYRTMSPEQARGETVDHRTDLFAFGVLLYEALTGVSPFEADNSLATVNRVIHHRQAPVKSLNPAAPEGLSLLIDNLLEKDPFLRPQSAGQVKRSLDALVSGTGSGLPEGTATRADFLPLGLAETMEPAAAVPGRTAMTAFRTRPLLATAALVTVATLLSGGLYLALRRPREPLYVAVLAPEVSMKGAPGELDLLASAVRVALLRQLAGLEGLSPREADDPGDAVVAPVQAAKAAGVDEVVRSQLVCRPEACRVALSRVRGSDGGVVWADSVEVPTDELSLAASAVGNLIRQAYSDFRIRKGIPDQRVSSRDFQEFLDLRRKVGARENLDTVLVRLEALRERSPGFVDAYLLEADAARRRFFFSRDAVDLERAFRLIREAREAAPGDPRPLVMLASVATDVGRPDQAESAIDELQRLIPGDVRVLDSRAKLLGARGRPDEAIAVLGAATARHPSTGRFYNLALMEYQRGLTADARRHLAEALQRSPGDRNSLALLAQLELAYGDARRAVEIYSGLVRRSPSPTQLTNLGLAYFTLGRYAEAAEPSRQALAKEPRNPIYALNLADVVLLMGSKEEAENLYRRVLALIDEDPAGSTDPQLLTVRAQALAHLGQGRPAVAAVQDALRLAPSNSQTAYEAALVYCLLGEEDSALVNAERALKLGYQRRWFTFPWFDRLRAHPEFVALLRDAPQTSR